MKPQHQILYRYCTERLFDLHEFCYMDQLCLTRRHINKHISLRSCFTLETCNGHQKGRHGVGRLVCDVTGGVLPMATGLLLTPDISGIPTRPASIVLQGTFHSSSSGKGKEKNGNREGNAEKGWMGCSSSTRFCE